MKTLHVKIVGRVQGVFFRDYTCRKAETLNLVGWVRNMPDGSVESLISGREEAVASMITWFHQGSPQASVREVLVEEVSQPPETDQFIITY